MSLQTKEWVFPSGWGLQEGERTIKAGDVLKPVGRESTGGKNLRLGGKLSTRTLSQTTPATKEVNLERTESLNLVLREAHKLETSFAEGKGREAQRYSYWGKG